MTHEEWAKIYLTELDSADGKVNDDEPFYSNEVPFTWVDKGAVGPVKN